MIHRNPSIKYHPSYWFSSLGAGGTAVSFFMYLMWMIPHKNTPIPTFADWNVQLNQSGFLSAITLVALAGVVVFSIIHFALLAWNMAESSAYKKDLAALKNTPAEIQLMAVPVTFAMSVNVLFILGALFVPNLWRSVELLFPGAIMAFAVIGFFAIRLFTRYIGNMVRGGYQSTDHNHLSALVSVFTFSMLAVGFAAASAMSHVAITAAIATTLSIGFLAFSLLLGIIVLSHGVSAIMKHGIAEPASPSLWMMIPILTLLGITWVRLSHGLAHHFGVESSAGSLFLPLTIIVMLQLGVFVLGYKVMKANHYLASYLHGDKASPVSFGLVCPGVALFVMGMFWWHIGWVKTGIIDPFGIAYWVGIAVLFGIQVITITALFKLLRKLLRHPVKQTLAHV